MHIKIQEIKAQETYRLRHEVMWPNMPLDFVKLDNDENGLHFGLYKDSNLVSVISLFINDDTAQFRKLATKVSEQGHGYASLLLQHIMSIVSNKNLTKVWCNARADKVSFYKRFGLDETSEKFIKEGINYVRMENKLTDNI